MIFMLFSTHPHSEISALACIVVKEHVAQVEKPFGNPFTQHMDNGYL